MKYVAELISSSIGTEKFDHFPRINVRGMPGGKACSSKRSFSVNLNDSDARFDENLAFIAECIRSEGHVGKSCMNFSNTCTEIISTFETNLKSTKIPYKLRKYFQIQVEIPRNIRKKNISITDGVKTFNFYLATIFPKVTPLHVLVFKDNEIKSKTYFLKINGNTHRLKTFVPEVGNISTEYSNGFSSCVLSLWISGPLRKLIKQIFLEGKFLKLIKSSPNSVFSSLLFAFLACDGGISYSKRNKLRQIYFDSKDRDYLCFLRRETEKRFNIRFRLYKTKHHYYRLVIMDKLNIIKFLHNVNLVSQHLRNKAKNVLDGYQRLTSDGEEVILSVIKKFEKIRSIQLAENVGKSQKQIIRWLNKLLSKGKIKKFRYRSFVYYNPS